ANSTVATTGSSFPSPTSRTSSPTPENNMNALVLRELAPLKVITPPTLAPTCTPVAPVEFTKSVDSLAYVVNPPAATFVLETTLLSQAEALLVSYSLILPLVKQADSNYGVI
ncbi:hypothetical protein J1N35_011599, partial [Gossypium stocksii]